MRDAKFGVPIVFDITIRGDLSLNVLYVTKLTLSNTASTSQKESLTDQIAAIANHGWEFADKDRGHIE